MPVPGRFPAIAAAMAVLPALAFFPPEDSRDGVTVRLIGFDEGRGLPRLEAAERDGAAPFEFDVSVENATGAAIDAPLSVWLNDDWEVAAGSAAPSPEAQTMPCAAFPHSTNVLHFSAIPREGRVLPALYPIHASLALPGGDPIHPVAVFRATGGTQAGPVFVQVGDGPARPVAECPETGAFFDEGWQSASGDVRFGYYAQPPWITGAGCVWRDIPVRLPAGTTLRLLFSMALKSPSRDSDGRSDGADYKVFVVEDGGGATEIHSGLVKSYEWANCSADLSPWAGKDVTVRLWNGSGPAGDVNYDRCLWGGVGVADGEDPSNDLAPGAPAAGRANLLEMPLNVRGEAWTAALTPGPCGLIDGTISFTDGEHSVSFSGFTCAIDNVLVGAGPLDALCTGWEAESSGGAGAQHPSCAIIHRIALPDGRAVAARATFFADGPALRIRWDMPGTVRSTRGTPRFTRLGLGPGSVPAARAYMSFGNVLENPRDFELTAGNFRNLARHAGADYPGGASLCQAVDVYPDRVVSRRESNVFAVETSHDATFSFVPSACGAFAAARAFRDVCGYKRSPSWREAATRTCLDQWGGGYATAVAGIEEAAKYGVTNAVFVRHGWQRWGFDYRLPEIWPAGGRVDGFHAMAAAAKRFGMLFAAHDNYIDYYPDAPGFSYDDIAFDAGGAPCEAWFNGREKAQSYRFAPGAFVPWLRRNAAALRDAVAPDACFIDVFGNLAPWDWFDRSGRFHERTETAAEWGEAFDEYRRVLGSSAGVMLSEAGHDALVGHLDAGQPDHFTAAAWMSSGEYDDAERVPWQDIVTHGSFVLYGGGLGWRYSSNSHARNGSVPETGSGSDSYMCTTVIGGRSPSCDMEPFDVRIVSTEWLLAAVCRDLALSDFQSFGFEGSIHRQRAVFADGEGGGGQVWVNRKGDWRLQNGLSLPPDGFYAETRAARAGIVEIGGRRCAFAESPSALYLDGRPDRRDGAGRPDTARAADMADFAPVLHPDARASHSDALALPCAVKTDGAFRLEREPDGSLLITHLPDQTGFFDVEIDLADIARPGATPTRGCAPAPVVIAVEPVGPQLPSAWPGWRQTGSRLSLHLDTRAFAARVRFSP